MLRLAERPGARFLRVHRQRSRGLRPSVSGRSCPSDTMTAGFGNVSIWMDTHAPNSENRGPAATEYRRRAGPSACSPVVAEFKPVHAGVMATVVFGDLSVSDWRSDRSSDEFRTVLARATENSYTALIVGDALSIKGGLQLPKNSMYYTDILFLQQIVHTVLDSVISKEPVAPGTRWQSQASYLDEHLDTSAHLDSTSEYVADTNVAGRRCAYLRAAGVLPVFRRKAATPEAVAKLGMSLSDAVDGTVRGVGRYDFAARRFAYVRRADHLRVRVGARSEQRDADFRIPITLYTVQLDSVTTTQLVREDIPPWAAEVSAAGDALPLHPEGRHHG